MTEEQRREALLQLAREAARNNPALAEAIARHLSQGTPLPPEVAQVVAARGIPTSGLGGAATAAPGSAANTPNPGPERAAIYGVDNNTAAGGNGASQGARGGAREYGPASGGSAQQARQAAGLPDNGAVETASQAAQRAVAEAAARASGGAASGGGGGQGGTSGGASAVPNRTNGGASAVTDATMAGLGNDTYLDLMFREAGLNPDILTESSKAAMRGLQPILQALRLAYGSENDKQAGGLSDFVRGFAKQAGQQGGNFYGNVQDYARGILGSSGFGGALGNLRDQSAVMQSYENLLPLLYAGSNPLYGQAASDVFSKATRQYNREDASSPAPGNTLFTTWLDQQAPQMTPFMRGIFGR